MKIISLLLIQILIFKASFSQVKFNELNKTLNQDSLLIKKYQNQKPPEGWKINGKSQISDLIYINFIDADGNFQYNFKKVNNEGESFNINSYSGLKLAIENKNGFYEANKFLINKKFKVISRKLKPLVNFKKSDYYEGPS